MLEAEVARDLSRLQYPSQSWVRPRFLAGEKVFDVVIVGGGQCGLSVAFGLLLERVDNILVLDANESGFEGPWLNYARMPTLRTGKTLTGPDFGIPSLTPQAWFEAEYGANAWSEITKIPREDWQRYLNWFSRTLNLPIRSGCKVELIEPCDSDLLCVHVASPDGPQRIFARKIVLATGMEGNGNLLIPENVRALPSSIRAHAAEPIDFTGLREKRVAVLGSGASAFDNAKAALQAGAAHVSVLARRDKLPTINPANWIQFSGFLGHFADMPENRRYEFLSQLFRHRQPATQAQYDFCMSQSNFSLRLNVDTGRIHSEGQSVRAPLGDTYENFDFLISATGFEVNIDNRPELSLFKGQIALWGDKFTPGQAPANSPIARFPYLGGGTARNGWYPH
jgi:cation diffusion facilitator CzcD-associated flavoprotein CzcO